MKSLLPFRPPDYGNSEENYQATFVYSLAWAWIVGVTAIISLMVAIMPALWMRGIEIIAAIDLSAFICLQLNHRKKLFWAKLMLPTALWVIASLLALTAGGIHSATIFAYLPIIITTGFLMGGVSGIVMTIMCILSTLFFVVLEMNGALPHSQVAHTPVTLWLSYSISGLLIAFMQFMATNHIQSFVAAISRESEERKLAEGRLKESEFFNRMVAENKILGVAWASPEGRVMQASGTFCRMLGYGEEELKGVYFGDFTHPDDVKRELALLDDILNHRIDNYTIEKRYKHKAGHYFWVELNLTCYRNADTDVINFFIGIVQNIQKRKQAEEGLKESEERYRALVDNAIEALVVLDVEEGRFVSVSESAVQLFKMSREELLAKNPMELSPQYQPDGSLSVQLSRQLGYVQQAITGGKPLFEWFHVDAEGRIFPAEVRLVRLPSTTRVLIRGCIIDITERKAAEEKIRELNESLEKKVVERTYELQVLNHDLRCFNTMLSHDLRGSIRRIKSFSELLLKSYRNGENAEAIETLNFIKRDAGKMDGIVTGLLEMSRLGGKPLQLKPVQLNLAVNNVLEDLKKQWKDNAVQTNIAELPTINSDPLLVQQIFSNLLSNAFKYSSKKEVIKVDVNFSERGDHYVFSVKDNGIGFDMAEHDKIFNEFTRLHHDHEYEGTGIGLNNVKRFVEKLGGRAWAQSAPNQGSTFYFTLPLQEVATEVR